VQKALGIVHLEKEKLLNSLKQHYMGGIYMTGLGSTEVIFLFFIFIFIPGVIAFIDVLRNEFTGSNKIVWIIAVIFAPFVGSIAYFIFGRKQKVKSPTY
jgi:hypothetical protein